MCIRDSINAEYMGTFDETLRKLHRSFKMRKYQELHNAAYDLRTASYGLKAMSFFRAVKELEGLTHPDKQKDQRSISIAYQNTMEAARLLKEYIGVILESPRDLTIFDTYLEEFPTTIEMQTRRDSNSTCCLFPSFS
eukprot:TRINITY_DN10547_c0_g1_i5.p1 TRINITY_DN10547_c0_g1~~TRINITY_DN10547_c0_g1_i5.p1  ORF type:complete len:156 (+),score=27.93 TRINITY_DN10547_c0_g1_i5:60-470(+)